MLWQFEESKKKLLQLLAMLWARAIPPTPNALDRESFLGMMGKIAAATHERQLLLLFFTPKRQLLCFACLQNALHPEYKCGKMAAIGLHLTVGKIVKAECKLLLCGHFFLFFTCKTSSRMS